MFSWFLLDASRVQVFVVEEGGDSVDHSLFGDVILVPWRSIYLRAVPLGRGELLLHSLVAFSSQW